MTAKEEISDNPFVRKLSLTKWQKLQVFLMSFTVAPVRFILAFILFAITWLFAVIATAGADASKPAVSVRKALYQLQQKLGRIILFVCGFHYMKVNGKRALYKDAPILLVVPHTSYWDVAVMFATSPLPCALSKYENFKIPVFGTLMKAVQPILVHRNNTESKRDTVKAIKHRMQSGEEWPQLVVFPEGTCTNKKYMINFKLGAFVAAQPIQPVVIKYKNSLDISTWTEISPSALYLIWLSLCQLQLNLEVTFLPVYKPSIEEKKDAVLYANQMRDYLSTHLQVPASDYSFEDRQLMKYAKKLNFPREAALLQFFRVSKALNIKFVDAKERLKEFAEISSGNCGVIDMESFSSFLKVPSSPAVKKLFNSLSLKSDEVTFYQYVMGYYSLVNTLKGDPAFSNIYNIYCSLVDGSMNQLEDNTSHAVAEIFRNSGVSNKDEFLQFLFSHPFHCKLALLINEKSYLNSMTKKH